MKATPGGWAPESSLIDNKNCKRYFYVENHKVFFTGDFDSGNLQRVEQIGPYEYRLWAGYDHATTLCTNKTFFHFKVSGFRDCRVRFHICRVNLLNSLAKVFQQHIQNRQSDHYRPVYRVQGSNTYHRIKEAIKITEKEDQDVDLAFQFVFGEEVPVYFAFAYPYSYSHLCSVLDQIENQISEKQIYYHREVLTLSNEHRKVHLITVTHKSNCSDEREEYIQGLFNINHNHRRPLKVVRKPRILVTARVHPGETSSSFCFQGLLRFLVDPKDYRAHLLRKSFQFLLVPMLNPDGVYHGMYRMDLNCCNLNRMYYHCDQTREPSIWAVKTLVEALGNVHFFFDLHGHASKKGFFVYGNAFEDIHLQTESELFAKLLEFNCPYFQKQQSNFSKKHMKVKQKADDYSKQGCARVFMYKTFNIVHSYTLECGFHTPNELNIQPPPKDTHLKFEGNYGYSDVYEKQQNRFYTHDSYMNLGKAILISILDVFEKNPYSRVDNSDFKTMDEMRRITATGIYQSEERFRMLDPNCLRKLRKTNDLIKDYYNDRFNYSNVSDKEKTEDDIKKQVPKTGKSLQRKKQSSNSIQSELIQPDKVIESRSSSKTEKNIHIRKLVISPKHSEKYQNINPSPKNAVRHTESISVQGKMRETAIWNLQLSTKLNAANPITRRKVSLKHVTTQKKILKLKGLPQEKQQQQQSQKQKIKFEPNKVNYQSLKNLKNNHVAPKQQFYEDFLIKKLDNWKNFVSTSDKSEKGSTELPRIEDRRSVDKGFRGGSSSKRI